MQALQDSRRLIQHHSSVVQKHLSALVSAVSPAVEALRSQTARAALVALQASPVHLPKCYCLALSDPAPV